MFDLHSHACHISTLTDSYSHCPTHTLMPTLSCPHSHAHALTAPRTSRYHGSSHLSLSRQLTPLALTADHSSRSHGGSLLPLSRRLTPLTLMAPHTSCPQAAAHNVLLVSPPRDIYQLTTAATASVHHPHLGTPHYKPI